jgi:hypothetical protein
MECLATSAQDSFDGYQQSRCMAMVSYKKNDFYNTLTLRRLNALFEGHFETIPSSELPAEFHDRGPYKKFGMGVPERMRIFEEFSRHWRAFSNDHSHSFYLHGINSDPFTHEAQDRGLSAGITAVSVTGEGTKTSFAFELIEPALNPHLSSAERMTQTVCLAAIILHESAVCNISRYQIAILIT